jgi:hypothetical protein
MHLVLDQGSRRQADVMGHNCKLDPASHCTEVGIDVGVTFPVYNSGQSERFVGSANHAYAKKKRSYRNTERNLNERGMTYFPAIVETNGVPSKSIAILIKKVATIANDQRGHDVSFFMRYWTKMWANTVTKAVARAVLSKCRLILSQSSAAGMPFYIEKGAFQSTTCEGPLVGRMH